MDKGWISLHRKFLDWEWFSDKNMIVLFIYLLLKANHSSAKWQGVEINKGELITSINKLSQALDISEQTIRTCLKKLEKTGEINKQSNTKLTKITICNYDSYQNGQQTTNKPLTNQQQTTNKRLTTNNNDNKNNNVNNDIKEIYDYYPSKCPIQNRSTSKGNKDKDKIERLLNNISKDELIFKIKTYIEDCKKSNTYVKNFSSFLNNLPDYSETKKHIKKTYSYRIHFTTFRNKSEKQYKEDLKQYGKELKLL